MTNPPITSYIHSLDIRMNVYRRNAIITGSVFLIALFTFFTMGMLEILNNQREIYLSALVLVFIGLSFIIALMRYECVKSVNELARVVSQLEARH